MCEGICINNLSFLLVGMEDYLIIANSSIGMDSVRTYTSVSREARRIEGSIITSFGDAVKKASEASDTDEVGEKFSEDSGEVEDAKRDFDSIYEKMKNEATSGVFESRLQNDEISRVKAKCIQYLLYCLFGIEASDKELSPISQEVSAYGSSSQGLASGNLLYYTVNETVTNMYAEVEETSFSTTGTVVTSDGREIEFNLELSMSRAFSSYYEENISYSRAFTDPLVINLDSDMAEVSDVKIRFDLDCDGNEESISMLSKNSGYLSLDLNDDGVINDGSELFGTSSGDGFKDLAKYDTDNNGFIDEADDIFDKLRICVFDDDGNQKLYSLKDKGVGAIGLANVDTQFSLNDLTTNEVNARIRKTGIFLYENGGIGTIQHLDLAQ